MFSDEVVMDPQTVILLIWILVSTSMICENEAVFGPRPTFKRTKEVFSEVAEDIFRFCY